ncbi:uncharacterized protein LOC127001551 isoform X1 [Eriocheir sinensis]|uniref:uncharacterized protein LOC127001551 isoform X1 n=1 Tax=Eriocheir sinensis TaxID=95602 RepID=UPI0021C74C8B|nr:uncharacterized protein LOC127001551 isoform X1 [Eriocheir sinensis]
MTESHTYVNTGPAAAKTDDTADIGFLTDANIYYNLPPPLPSAHCRGASLPRGHFAAHHQLARGSSSCPASPKLLTAFPPPRPDVNRHEKGAREAPTPPARPSPVVTPRHCDNAQEGDGKVSRSPPLKARGAAKPRGKKLPHTRSFDLDHIYQNLVRVASKPRSNSFSIDLPWRRRKKVVDVTPPGIREDSGEDSHIGLTQNEAIPPKPEPPKEPVSVAPMTGDYLGICNSSSSSSSSNGSENDGVAGDCTAEMRPGVTYLRKHGHRAKAENSSQEEAVNLLYHTTATLPMPAGRSTQGVSGPDDAPQSGVDQRPVLDVNANLDEWLRKERWLEKKRCSRNFRSTNESGEVDISILHASDGDKWKKYLYDVFTQLVPEEDRARSIRVEASNVEEIEEDLGRLQAAKLTGAKLQIVIMSPCFLTHIAGHGNSELGQVFRPEKVLALLLGVDDSQLNMAHLSALYSYNDWHKLKVRNMDLSFVYEVLTEGIKILNNCELYSKYQDERNARFKITPRKVTEMQQLVHLMLNDPVGCKRDIEVLIENPNKPVVIVERFKMRNPYTIEFRMPDNFMAGSSLLLVTVLVQRKAIGSRQLKCESTLDSMRALLNTISNPTLFMCQALNINPTSKELDQKLTEMVRTRVPLSNLVEQKTDKCCSEFPTWVHFSAFYGLERLTWALLEIPGGEAALNRPNSHGHTPSVLAYQKGFLHLAHALEDAALMSSLAAKLNYEPVNYKNLSKIQSSTKIAAETYSCLPPPRPVNSSSYDCVPSPQEVPFERSYAEIQKHMHISTQSPQLTPSVAETNASLPELPLLSPPPPPPPPPYSCQMSELPPLPPPPFSSNSCETQPPATSAAAPEQPHKERKDWRYLEMKVAQDYKDSTTYEYSEDVYTLVAAWLEKTDIKAFVEEHQEKIGEVKSRLDLNNTKEENLYVETESVVTPGEAQETQADEAGEVSSLKKQENMVEQFFTLIRGKSPQKSSNHIDLEGGHSLCDLPNEYVDDPTEKATKETSPEPECEEESSTPSFVDAKRVFEDHFTFSAPGPSGLTSSPRSMEGRLPEPPPRPKPSETYLQPEDINPPKVIEQVEMEKRRSKKSSPQLTRNQSRGKSNSQEDVTPAPDEKPEMHYAVII